MIHPEPYQLFCVSTATPAMAIPGNSHPGAVDAAHDAAFRTCRRLRVIGVSVSILILWNGVCDLIYGYSSILSGSEYLSSAVWDTILTAGHRPHRQVMLAQTAGWLYPLYALTFYHWWIGMRRAGFWLADVPCLLLAYAVLMIGGIQHAGWAFLSVLARAKDQVGSTDVAFYAVANRYLLEHFVMGDLTAVIALSIGIIWHAVGILSGQTMYPTWFVAFSPLATFAATVAVGVCLPAPCAGFLLAPVGTWMILVPCLASTVWLWNRASISN